MKLNKLLIILSAITSIFVSNIPSSVVAETTPVREVNNAHDYSVQWTNDDFGDYYKNIVFDSNLSSQITSLITQTHHTNTTYNGLASLFKESDVDPNNSNKILWFYTGTSVSFSGFGSGNGDTNREHVFPKNAGNAFPEKSGPGSDGHHLRPTETQLNSIRSSKSFGEVPQTTSNIAKQNGSTSYNSDPDKLCYTTSTYFYPGKGYRGQTARILFYVVARWGGEYNLSFVNGSGNNKTIGDISTLLKWNLEEPVTQTEITRNNVVAAKQGNRNPFIDNPFLACSIWGDLSKDNICDDYQAIVNPYTGDITLPDGSGSGGSTDTGGSGDSSSGDTTTVSWGTATSPLTTSEAISKMANFTDQESSTSTGFVKGTITEVTEINDEYKNITFTLDDKFIIWRAKSLNGTYDASNPEIKVGDSVVVNGTFTKYGTKYEMTNGQVVSINSSSDSGNTGGNTGGSSTGTVSEVINFDFSEVSVESCSYASNVNRTIEGKDYYFSNAYITSGEVRLGHKNAVTLDSKLGISGSGSYFEPKFDIENLTSFKLEVVNVFSNTDSYVLLFKETNSSTYSKVSEGPLSIGMTIEGNLSEPKNGHFVLVILGTKARISIGQFSLSTGSNGNDSGNTNTSPSYVNEFKSLNLLTEAYYMDDEAKLVIGLELEREYVEDASKYGILVFSKNQLGNNEIIDLYDDENLSDFISKLSKYNFINYDFSNYEIYDGTQLNAIVSNCTGKENFKFTAVGYIEVDGKVYFTNEISVSYNEA